MNILFTAVLFFLVTLKLSIASSKPNIIFIVADDLGWDDVGYHGSTQVKTPNIDNFASNSVTLESHYVNPLCSPSRASLLTGRYASSLGLQHSVIIQGQRVGVPLNESLLSEYLREYGYATHAIGKWHLGYFAKEYTPTGRGFDSFYGFYNENNDYYDHSSSLDYVLTNKLNPAWGLDWHLDQNGSFEFVYDDFGKYSTDILTDRAIKILQNYSDSEQPLFMYLAYQAVHSANQDDPLQAPQEDINEFPNIYDNRRRITAGMIYNLDKNMGRLLDTLNSEGYMSNTFILFLTDNGGPTLNCDFSWASNYPLRGSKHTLYEGGVRGVALAYGPNMTNGNVNNELIHVSDWVPTVLEAAGVEVPSHLDGVSQYESLIKQTASPRTELLHNVDQTSNYSAIRMGDVKMIMGKWSNGYGGCPNNEGWYTPPGPTPISGYKTENPTVKCNGKQPKFWQRSCWSNDYNTYLCMFNITEDPCEYENIVDSVQVKDLRDEMLQRLKYYFDIAVAPRWPLPDITAFPSFHNFTWGPWTTDTTMWELEEWGSKLRKLIP